MTQFLDSGSLTVTFAVDVTDQTVEISTTATSTLTPTLLEIRHVTTVLAAQAVVSQ